jgi:hypothetical protein
MSDKRYGLFVDYKYFSGNHAAEIACKEEMQLPIDQWGIKEVQIGPFKKGEGNDGDDWEWFFLPVPTSIFSEWWGDGTRAGKPLAVQVEESATLEYGPIDELAQKLIDWPRQAVLFKL